MTVGIVADEAFLDHKTGVHVESPERLHILYEMLREEGLDKKTLLVKPRYATDEELLLNHTEKYITMLRNMGVGYLDADTVLSEMSFDVARLAAGGSINMIDDIMNGRIIRGFALIRPPGHHAERDRGMGFCLFNNIAIAARHLMKRHGLKKVALLDWDLHHGNGTEHSFYDEKELLYLSIHQSPCYPGTGGTSDRGEGRGEGYTMNFPRSAGAGDAEYIDLFHRDIIPAISDYSPEMILVSAGFDPHMLDPLGGMRVTADGFGEMGRLVMELADDLCEGKIAFFLEGGYSLEGLRDSVRELLFVALDE